MTRILIFCCVLWLSVLVNSTPVFAAVSLDASMSAQDRANELFRFDEALGAEGGAAGARLERVLSNDVLVPTAHGDFARGREQALHALAAGPLRDAEKVTWQPVRVGVSADGTHGFTVGYQQHVLVDGSSRLAKYLSYWVRSAASWQLKAHRITRSAAGPVDLARLPDFLPASSFKTRASHKPEHHVSLSAAEQLFSNRAQVVGLGPAFAEFGRADSINLGGAATANLVLGAESIAEVVAQGEPERGSSVFWSADEATVAAPNGDLGVTFGFIRFHASDKDSERRVPIPFFTIWARTDPDAPWRYVAE